MSNDQIIGHYEQKKILERFVAMPHMHHAFLFVGSASVGKKTIARAFAQKMVHGTVNSEWIINDRVDSDIMVVAPRVEQKKKREVIKDISVEQILDARKSFALAADKNAKVMIIDDAHRMTISAQNALLKTLEEPPKKGFIILVSSAHDRLLDTIRSRCVHVQFSILNDQELQKMSSDESMIVNAQGRPGFVRRMQDDEMFLACVTEARGALQSLAKTCVHERMSMAADLAKKDDLYIHTYFSVWVHRIRTVSYETGKFHLIKASGKIDDVLHKMETSNVNKQLIIEDLLLHIV